MSSKPVSGASAEQGSSLLRILAWFVFGAAIGYALGRWVGSGGDWALVVSTLMIPLSIWLGWGLILLAAMVSLPFLLPGVLRHVGKVAAQGELSPEESREVEERLRRRRRRVSWAFVFACVQMCFVAGLISGAPITYAVVGLAAGLLMRRSDALLDVDWE